MAFPGARRKNLENGGQTNTVCLNKEQLLACEVLPCGHALTSEQEVQENASTGLEASSQFLAFSQLAKALKLDAYKVSPCSTS